MLVYLVQQIYWKVIANKPKMMSSSSHQACVPHVVSNWFDGNQNGRVLVVIAMPSGTHILKNTEIPNVDGGSCLNVFWQWLQIMINPNKIFAHSHFKGMIQASHPKVIAFVTETDKIQAETDNNLLQK
jgi:hypothetical protein